MDPPPPPCTHTRTQPPTHPPPPPPQQQQQQQPTHARILVDWALSNHVMSPQVTEDYSFNGQTAWMSINYFDRYLSLAPMTPKQKIELISLSCLLIASKFLECRSPSLEDLCTLSQNRLSKEDFISAELFVLMKLDWQLAVPSPHAYVHHLLRMVDVGGGIVPPALIQKHAEFFIDLSAFGKPGSPLPPTHARTH